MTRHRIWALLISIAIIILSVPVVQSQAGTTLSYGAGAVGAISAETPFAAYNFGAGQGDIISIQVNSLVPGFRPSASINSPSGQQLDFSSSDPYSIGNGNARIDVLITLAGNYTVQVGSADGSSGQFMIRLNGIQTANAQLLASGGTPLPLAFVETSAFQVVAVPQSPDGNQTLTINGGETGYSAAYFDSNGNLRDVLLPESGGTTTKTVSGGDGIYYLVVNNLDRAAVTIELILTGGSSTAPPTTNLPPPTNVCTITTGNGGTNLRGGPGTSYNIVTTMPGNTSYPVTGQNNGWYTIDYNGQTGWLAGSVTTLTGPCSAVPFAQAPAALAPVTTEEAAQPPVTTEEAPPPTVITEEAAQPPVTTEEAPPPTVITEEAPPQQPTQPPIQTAPEDGSYFVDVSVKNGVVTHSDYVSYPNGDVEDEIFWNVVDFDSTTFAGTLEVIITCTGEGASNLNFFSSGSNYACGDIISRTVTNDSDSGLIRVTATGGDNIYVGYTLLFRGNPS